MSGARDTFEQAATIASPILVPPTNHREQGCPDSQKSSHAKVSYRETFPVHHALMFPTAMRKLYHSRPHERTLP